MVLAREFARSVYGTACWAAWSRSLHPDSISRPVPGCWGPAVPHCAQRLLNTQTSPSAFRSAGAAVEASCAVHNSRCHSNVCILSLHEITACHMMGDLFCENNQSPRHCLCQQMAPSSFSRTPTPPGSSAGSVSASSYHGSLQGTGWCGCCYVESLPFDTQPSCWTQQVSTITSLHLQPTPHQQLPRHKGRISNCCSSTATCSQAVRVLEPLHHPAQAAAAQRQQQCWQVSIASGLTGMLPSVLLSRTSGLTCATG